MASLLVPVLYVVIVFGSLYIFSHLYRKHSANKSVEPYFDSHPERNAYITLLQKSDPPASDSLLKAALIRRAVADVQRVIRLREDKPALQNLLQKGAIGEELWNSLLAAEKELEAEIMDVVAEANSFVEGWGSVIFPTANEVIANEKIRHAFDHTAETRSEYERKYNKKSTNTALVLPTSTPSPVTITPAAQQPPRPQTPPSAKASDGLVPPPSAGPGSAASSDGEAVSSPTPSSGAPRSKASNKKGKKRR